MGDYNLKYCSFAKSILMICVVLCHSCAFWTEIWFPVIPVQYHNHLLGTVATWLGTFHVYGFTIISGYIYQVLYSKGYYPSFSVFLKKKALRLIISYLLVSIFYVIPVSTYFYHLSYIEIICNFFLGKNPQQLWFLLVLFEIFILFFLLQKILSKISYFLTIIIMLFMFFLGIEGRAMLPNFFQLFTTFIYFPFFCLGYILSKYESAFFCDKLFSLKHPFCYMTLFVTSVFLFFVWHRLNLMNGKSLFLAVITRIAYLFVTLFGSVSIISLLFSARKKFPNDGKLWKLLSDNCFGIYLFHQQIIYLSLFLLNGRILPELHVIVNILLSTGMSLLY